MAESLTCRTASRCWRIVQGGSQKACESQGDTGVFFLDKIPTLQLTICAMAGKFLNPLCLCPLPGNRGAWSSPGNILAIDELTCDRA